MSDTQQPEPEDYAEALAWFNECKARRARDRERRIIMETTNKNLHSHIVDLKAELAASREMVDELAAELAALKARRCEGCGSWSMCWVYDASVSDYGEHRPEDVWCESWTARKDGGS